MGEKLNIITPLHTATPRDYLARMNDDKVACMEKARRYEEDYWDGDRRFGYGGYHYRPGRWAPVAQALIQQYDLKAGSRVLDIGCGKGFLLYEMQRIEPEIKFTGLDVSSHALKNSHPGLRGDFRLGDASGPLPFADAEFDLVLSLNTLHNLKLPQLARALPEMQRVGRNAYLVVESYRNASELFNLQCWALTAEAFFDEPSWIWLFEHFGYHGDYEFIYFE